MTISQSSATILAAFIAIIPAMTALWFNDHNPAQKCQGKNDQDNEETIVAAIDNETSRISQSTARRPTAFKALFFIAWGQTNIALALCFADPGGLSTWSVAFIGQGLVMLLLGFWLLLRD